MNAIDHSQYEGREQAPETPNNIEAEQALLGAILVNNDAFYLVNHDLSASDFYEPLHRRIFEVATELLRMGKTVNPVTIKTFLPANEKLGDMTVAQYLARLAAEAVTVINAPDYAKEVRELAQRRALITVGQDLIRVCFDMPTELSPREASDRFIEQASEATGVDGATAGSVSFGDAFDSAMRMMDGSGGKKGGGVQYHFDPLYRLIGPLSGGQLIILGGATKQGKTALVSQIAMGAALNETPVWNYSGEMTPEEIVMREIARSLKVPVTRQKRQQVTEQEFETILALRSKLYRLPILIQNRRLTIAQLKERCRRVVRKRGRTVLIVDHIGLIDRDRTNGKLSEWEFGQEVTRELKTLARELDCPILACAQLKKNTFAENKGPVNEKFLTQIVQRRPRYSDLIGAVERDADHVVIPFRPEVFLAEHEPAESSDFYLKWEDMMKEWRGKAQIVLALSRESKWPRHVNVGWDGASTTFYETGSDGERDEVPSAGFLEDPMRLV